MRSGACTVQQTLTQEAASILKHSLSLARRRGHAQVTPLHVAATLLTLRTSLLRRACLKSHPQQPPQPHAASSHSHPFQCRALELCFNVALNRLPTSPTPLIHSNPSLSNALVAALKRAQAHQRRGCIEQQQQQPLLTIKVELEQLVISILDDPSVSRVMREAGFSSTVVKNNIEDSSNSNVFKCYNTNTTGGVFSSPCSPSPPETFWQTHFFSFPNDHPSTTFFSPQKRVPLSYISDSALVKEDVKLVLEVLLGKKKKNTVIVGDSVSITEGLVGELMGKVERGEVPVELKQTQFIKFQFSPVSLRFMKKEDVEMNVSELRKRVDSIEQTGAIIYAGDLKWTVDQESGAAGGVSSDGGYSPVNHLVTEIGRLISEYGSSGSRVWLMATASYQTYMRCQMRQPPLEALWALQAVSVPTGGLGLSLHASSNNESRKTLYQNPSQVIESKPFIISYSKEEQDKITCCPECTSNYEKEAQFLKSGHNNLLPAWLHPQGTNTNQKDEFIELKKKWSRQCLSLNHHQSRHDHLVSATYNQCPTWKNQPNHLWATQNCFLPSFNSISFTDSTSRPNHTSSIGIPKFATHHPSLDSLKKEPEGKEVKISLSLGNCFVSDSGKLEKGTGDFCRFLQENLPWQCAVIPSIVQALSDSKCGKRDTWLVIQGNDLIGKRKLALAIAESLLGSPDSLLCINIKEGNNETPYSETLAKALRNKERLVVFVENVDFADAAFLKFLSDGFETGKFGDLSPKERHQQAIFLLSKDESLGYEERRNRDGIISMVLKVTAEENAARYVLPGMENKRKADLEITGMIKAQKFGDREDVSQLFPVENGSSKRDRSCNNLDLNLKADEDDESQGKPGEFSSPVSSDLTLETSFGCNGFLDSIKNQFVFRRDIGQEMEMKEYISRKMRRGYEECFGGQNSAGFSIEERVLEEVVNGLGSFVNSELEKWVKEVFKTSLEIVVKHSGKGGIVVKLCFGGKSDRILEDGFMGTNLPNNIQVSLVN